jgi:Fe-S-cluster containining protein
MPDESDPIIREIPRIRRYCRHNEAEDYRFRTFLKVHLNLPNAELDGVVRETTDAVWKQIDCTTCANCCRTLQVVVDDQDIQRLAERLGMTRRQFTRRYVRVAEEDGTRHLAATPCPFLGSDNRCTVYEDRPRSCRDFPYLHAEGFRNRTLVMIENAATCPIVFNVWQALKKRLRPPARRQRRR